MIELNSKYGIVKIFTDNIESQALSQVSELANTELGENANIRIMSDVHSGKGCVIGTTMKINDKICPNLVGVDLNCGVTLVKTDIDFGKNLPKLDEVIRNTIPNGKSVYINSDSAAEYIVKQLSCYDKLPRKVIERACHSLGTLGGGNHFIEAYDGGYIAVHSGSRNIGKCVAEYYQELAESSAKQSPELSYINPKDRELYLKSKKANKIPKHLSFLMGDDMEDYLHDVSVMYKFANRNRMRMLSQIITNYTGKILGDVEVINTTHNYIDVENMILRKGAVSAQKGEKLVIPLNMRDGMLICLGKGNEDWNYSAPHGAGRLYSRSKAKQLFDLEDFKTSMANVYTTCVNESTIDESPFVYKDFEEIISHIGPTVEILKRIIPIYNFKSSE